jgi:hypothetical protein
MQLALAQAELPLLEIIDSKHSWTTATAYLRQLNAGDLIESVMDASLTADMLVENMDYEILPPTFGQEDVNSESWKRAVRNGYLRRLYRSRALIDALCLLDEKKFSKAREAVDQMRAYGLESQLDASLSMNCSASEFDGRPLPSFVSSGSGAFDSLLWTASTNTIDFVVETALYLQRATAEVAGLEGRAQVDPASALLAVHTALQEGLLQLYRELDVRYELPCPQGTSDKSHRVLDPVWLRKASALVRVLVPVAALVLEFLSLPVHNDNTGSEVRAIRLTSVADSGVGGKKNSAKKKASTSAAGAGAPGREAPSTPADSIEGLARSVSAGVIRLLGEKYEFSSLELIWFKFFTYLRIDMLSTKLHDGETSVTQASVLGFIEAWQQQIAASGSPEDTIAVELLFPDGAIARQRGYIASVLSDSGLDAADEEGVASALRAALEMMLDSKAATASQVASSQRTSCARLAEVVDHKLKHLKHLFA